MAGHVQSPHGSDRLRDPDNASAAYHQAAGVQTDQVKSGELYNQLAASDV